MTRVADGRWHHLAGTYDGTTVRQYLDGVLLPAQGASQPSSGTPRDADAPAQPVTIGAVGSLASYRFTGAIDEVLITNRVKTSAEIRQQFESRLPNYRLLWDSSPTDAGAAMSSCTAPARCADVTYGDGGSAELPLSMRGYRYVTRAKLRSATNVWSSWSPFQWFSTTETAGGVDRMYAHDSNASAGALNSTTIGVADPRLSWRNQTNATANRARVQVFRDTGANAIATWRFDTATGVTHDSSGNGRSLTPVDPPTSASGPAADFAQAARFDGAADGFTASTALNLTGEFSVEAWIRMPSAQQHTYGTIIAKQETVTPFTTNYLLDVDRGNAKLQFCSTSSGAWQCADTPVGPLQDGEWHHAVGTRTATSATLYIDGVQVHQVPSGAADQVPAEPLRLGASNGGDYFLGDIDEVRLSTVAYTGPQVAAMYARRMPTYELQWDSDPTEAGAGVIASCVSGNQCGDVTYGVGGSAAVPLEFSTTRYFARAKLGAAGAGFGAWSSLDWFQTTTNVAPTTPTLPVQLRDDASTVIPTNGWTAGGSSDVVLRFTASDANNGATVTPWVELRAAPGDFAATCGQSVPGVTFAGTPIAIPVGGTATQFTVRVPSLAAGSYVWRACAVDHLGGTGGWFARGSNPDFRVDTSVPAPATPRDGATGTDADSTGSAVELRANWDAVVDGGSGTASYDWCFNTAANCTTPTASGNVAAPTVSVTASSLTLTPGQTYYACVRSRDNVGNASTWTCNDGQVVMDVSAPAPVSGAQGRNDMPLRINGLGFEAGVTIDLGAGITVVSYVARTATYIDVLVDIGSAAATGARSITVTNPAPGGTITSASAFTVSAQSITVGISGLSLGDTIRGADPISFGAFPAGGGTADIGSLGAAAIVSVNANVETTLHVGSTNFISPDDFFDRAALKWRLFGAAPGDPWFDMTASAAIESQQPVGSYSRSYEWRLAVPAGLTAGNYQATVSYTAVPAV